MMTFPFALCQIEKTDSPDYEWDEKPAGHGFSRQPRIPIRMCGTRVLGRHAAFEMA